MTTQSAAAAKAALRARIRVSRASRSRADQIRAGEAIRHTVLSLPEIEHATVIAAYVDSRGEPPTMQLLSGLGWQHKQVLLPVQAENGDLDWAPHTGVTAEGPHGIPEPTSDRLGVDAIATAQVIVVPALAVDRAGHRLGQGGGGYDRALARAAPGALTVAVLYDDEFLEEVPAESHDISVFAVATPTMLIRCGE